MTILKISAFVVLTQVVILSGLLMSKGRTLRGNPMKPGNLVKFFYSAVAAAASIKMLFMASDALKDLKSQYFFAFPAAPLWIVVILLLIVAIVFMFIGMLAWMDDMYVGLVRPMAEWRMKRRQKTVKE